MSESQMKAYIKTASDEQLDELLVWIEEKKKQDKRHEVDKAIEQARADEKAGRVYSMEEIDAWLKSDYGI